MTMAKRKSQIAGRWRIISMEMWDNDFIDAEVPGYINFAKDGLGDFQFGYVRCDIDWQVTERDGEPAVDSASMVRTKWTRAQAVAGLSSPTMNSMV